MDGYEFERTFITPGAAHSPAVLVGGARAQLLGRRSDLIHVHGEVAAGLSLPGLALIPSVVTIHGLHLVRRLVGWRRALALTNLRLIVRAATRTICVGDAEFAEIESLLGGGHRLALIRNGVDPLPARLRRNVRLPVRH